MTEEQVKERLVQIKSELAKLPEGHLVKRRGFYTHSIDGKGIGITKDLVMIKQLCRKKFLIELRRYLMKAVKMFSICESIPSVNPIELIKTFSKTYQNLPIEYFYHSDLEKWIDAPFIKNTYPIESGGYKTTNGIIVRSKSELIIANQLEALNIPYRYDTGLKLSGKIKYPDFIIRNPFSGKLIIWEHFGALNESGYEKAMNEKMELYLSNGFTRFNDLIYTFEFDIKSPERLKKLINEALLRTS